MHWHQEFVRLFDSGHIHDAAGAADNFEHALEGIKDAQGWYILGNDYNAVLKSDQAIRAFNQSLTILPNNADAINGLGVAYQHLGENNMALKYFRQAAALGNSVAQQNANALVQSQTAPAASQPSNNMGDKVRAIQEYENIQRCGNHSC